MNKQDPQWIKVRRGFYRLANTRYAVQADGYPKSQSIGSELSTGYEGFVGGEWAVIRYADERRCEIDQGGDNMDWFPTMREARAAAERMAR